MARSRTETWLGLIVAAMGLIPVAIVGLWAYMGVTATPLHPSAEDVPARLETTPSPQWTDPVAQGRQVVRAALTEHYLPGVSVAVGVGNDVVWAEGFGWADLEKREPVTPETKFRVGTASMALTSAAAGLLLERGHLDLDAGIQGYVPRFPEKQWPVTLRQVMGHVAGVRNDGGDEGPLLSRHCEKTTDGLESFADRPLLSEPGTKYRFSSYGWILVSAAIEAAAGEPLVPFMQKHIFEPLGMRDTMADCSAAPAANQATPYFPRFAADPRYGLHLMRPVDYSCYSGSSIFVSTPSDLVRFGVATNGGALLKPSTVQLLQTSQRLASGEETGYGLGWDVETVTLGDRETRWIGHEGTSLGGPVASLMTLPDHGLVVAVLSNISYTDTEALALKIAQAFAAHDSAPVQREGRDLPR